MVFYIAHSGSLGVMKTIQRNPISFGDEQWFDHQNIDPELLKLLPAGPVDLSPDTIRELESLFGPGGQFDLERRQRALH